MGRYASIVALFLTSGCDFTRFTDLEDTAPVVAMHISGSRAGGYGRVLTTYDGELDGEDHSRIAVSAGPGSEFFVIEAWARGELELGAPLDSSCDDEMIADMDCDAEVSSVLLGLPTWGAAEMCLVIVGKDSSNVRCPTDADSEPLGGMRISAAAYVPRRNGGGAISDLVISDTATDALRFRSAKSSNPHDLDDLDGGSVGALLAATRMDDGTLVIATGVIPDFEDDGPPPTDVGIYVYTVTDEDGDPELNFHARLPPAGAITFARLDGIDEEPSLAVADPAFDGGSFGDGELRLYDLAELPDAGSGDPWDAAQTVPCPDREGIDCDGAAFGLSVAAGDIDGDGDDDIAIGAPNADVEGKARSGAIYLLPADGNAVNPDAGDVLRLSKPLSNDRLGVTVAMVRTFSGDSDSDIRAEPVAGVPGSDSVVVFLCSDLDKEDPVHRCLP